jgi:ribosomal subunit interface protein
MQLTIQGKQLDVGNALRTHVEEKLSDLNSKYFNHGTFASVTFAREGHGHGLIHVHIQMRIGKDIQILSDATEGDPYGAFDTAAVKLARQLSKQKERLRNHNSERGTKTVEREERKAAAYASNGGQKGRSDDYGIPVGKDPVIIAELTTALRTMSVSDAVLRMDLTRAPALAFRNPKTGGVNMVYRRADGNIGWVDPGAEQKRGQAAKPAASAPAKPAAKKHAKATVKKLKPAKPAKKAKAKAAKPAKPAKKTKTVKSIKSLKAVKSAKPAAKRAKGGRR